MRSWNVWLRWLALVLMAGVATGRPVVALVVALFVVGNFVDDQKTHLAQFNHQTETLSLPERLMQSYPNVCGFVGAMAAILGLYLVVV